MNINAFSGLSTIEDSAAEKICGGAFRVIVKNGEERTVTQFGRPGEDFVEGTVGGIRSGDKVKVRNIGDKRTVVNVSGSELGDLAINLKPGERKVVAGDDDMELFFVQFGSGNDSF